MSKEFIARVQRGLTALGYNVGPADGIAGTRTLAAVTAWERSLGIGVSEPVAPIQPPAEWDERSKRNLQGVHPDMVRVMARARELSPVPFTVIEGVRSRERQRQLVAQGASKTMNSRHITGHAVDIVPHRPNGDLAFDWPLYHKLAPAVKQAATELGVAIVWGGDWRTFKDGPHFELDRRTYP